MMDVANLNVLPSDDIYMEIFDFTLTDPYRENFGFAGYETCNWIMNLGTLFIIIALFMLYMAFTFLILWPLTAIFRGGKILKFYFR